MTNALPPLIEPNGRISHIRLSELIHRAAFPAAVVGNWCCPGTTGAAKVSGCDIGGPVVEYLICLHLCRLVAGFWQDGETMKPCLVWTGHLKLPLLTIPIPIRVSNAVAEAEKIG